MHTRNLRKSYKLWFLSVFFDFWDFGTFCVYMPKIVFFDYFCRKPQQVAHVCDRTAHFEEKA